jgi:hypothetical protein
MDCDGEAAEVSDSFRQFPARGDGVTEWAISGGAGGFRPFRPFRPFRRGFAAGPAGRRAAAPHQRCRLTTEEDSEVPEVSSGRRETLVTKTLVTVSGVSLLICRALIMMPIL